MSVRFKVDVERSATRFGAGLLQCEYLSVLQAIIGVGPGADDVAVRIRDDCADVGTRRGQTYSLASQFQRAVNMLFVSGVRGHSGKNLTRESGEVRSYGFSRLA